LSKVIVLSEVFFPEDFIVNDLVQHWAKLELPVEVLTRVPSYPFGRVYDGYANRFYQKTLFGETTVFRIPVLEGYQKSRFKKILNYILFVFFCTGVLLRIAKRGDRIFVYQTGPLTVAVPAVLAKLFLGTKLIVWTQDLWPETVYAYGFKRSKALALFLDNLVEFVYQRCDYILVSCKGFGPRLKRFLKPNQSIQWIPNWSLLERIEVLDTSLPGSFNFTFAGNIGKVQNLEKVIEGFRSVPDQFPNAWLNIIGDGSNLEDLKRLVNEKRIRNVNFTGRKSLEEMPGYFNKSDVLIISLVDDPLYEIMIPSKFQTYLVYEKPLFAIMKGEVPSLVKEYGIGISANPSDLAEIQAEFLEFLSLDSRKLENMGSNALKLSNNLFARNQNLEILTEIIGEAKSPKH
jgi:glycosyltransferase involved in cell wall biosynthesis